MAAAVSGDAQLGADAVHDAFVLAVRHRRRFRSEGPLEKWIWRIVVKEARKRRVERARLVATDPAALEPPASSNGAGPAHRPGLSSRRCRSAKRLTLFLRYYADLDHGGIAAALDVTPGTVAATLNTAHAALRKQLQEVDHD